MHYRIVLKKIWNFIAGTVVAVEAGTSRLSANDGNT